MVLRRANQFTPLLLPCFVLPGAETGLVEDPLVWLSEKLTWSLFLLGLVAKFCFGEYSGAAKVFRAAYGYYNCVACSPFMYCLGTDIYIYIYIYIVVETS